jgi:hypothetical protein
MKIKKLSKTKTHISVGHLLFNNIPQKSKPSGLLVLIQGSCYVKLAQIDIIQSTEIKKWSQTRGK